MVNVDTLKIRLLQHIIEYVSKETRQSLLERVIMAKNHEQLKLITDCLTLELDPYLSMYF